MDGMLWQLVLANLVTPNFPFVFLWRVAVTTAAAGIYPWWMVLIIANFCGGLGMFPVYALTKWLKNESWASRVARTSWLLRLRDTLYAWWLLRPLGRLFFPLAKPSWQRMLQRDLPYRRLRYRLRRNMFLTQVMMNVTPLPDFISSSLAGYERYPFSRLLISQLIGRTFHNGWLVLGGAVLGRYPWFQQGMSFIGQPLVMLTLTLATFIIWRMNAKTLPQPQTVA